MYIEQMDNATEVMRHLLPCNKTGSLRADLHVSVGAGATCPAHARNEDILSDSLSWKPELIHLFCERVASHGAPTIPHQQQQQQPGHSTATGAASMLHDEWTQSSPARSSPQRLTLSRHYLWRIIRRYSS
ncbi:hypothetical protein CEXT_261221 [Caerostris extrusa]|uniref:Uncharacterized protein n=1 Tax=Caerostris extrusa TaxID=172846 RepID=A0AAV4U0F9_CAEEX|nr:hypothetical protein CEXT_261221 [Caerostris extrusa]